ncbi:hypothetical protein CABS01_05342 [Colletotrichum abscissum]|uniref:uncharacterized protein n=1 Tax=Colletotrichum abscissum TaxID=1671311 RepID=UPI0027D5B37E|nr:uncharacterized protein CABS01_05342 [Colletotrichum abscissum]KAK1523721.1 hypothetical protein CABS01_05342 [Colletotrichum abscissum]
MNYRSSPSPLLILTAKPPRPPSPAPPPRPFRDPNRRGVSLKLRSSQKPLPSLTVLTLPLPAPKRLVEIRAAQRTFEGAYMRTALSQFSFALIILKIFTSEFYAIGALFAVYGAAVMLVAIFRRHEGNRQFFTSPKVDEGSGVASGGVVRKFRTSGNSVAMLTVLSLAAYVTLLVLTWQLVQ